MKKVSVIILTLIIVALLGFNAFAVNVYYYYDDTDFSKSWAVTKNDGDVELIYHAKTNAFSASVYSQTGLFLTPSGRGYVASTTTAINNLQAHEFNSGTVSGGGWLRSPKATVSGQSYAKEILFYADTRSAPNVIVNIWQWDYN